MSYYVYLYLDEDATPYYVGKGTNSRCTDCHGDIPDWFRTEMGMFLSCERNA